MWIEVVFWGLIVLYAVIGLYKGLFDSILSLIGTGVAVAVGVWLAKPAAGLINKIVNVPNMFEKLLNKAFESSETVELWSNVFNKKDLAAFLSLVFAGIIVFVLVKLAIWLLAKLFDGVTKNSSIASGLNRVLGLIFGFVQGGFVVCVLLALCSIITGTQVVGNTIDNAIDKAPTTKWVYKYVDDFTEDQLSKIDMKEFLKNLVSSSNENKDENSTDTQSGNQTTTIIKDNVEYVVTFDLPSQLVK